MVTFDDIQNMSRNHDNHSIRIIGEQALEIKRLKERVIDLECEIGDMNEVMSKITEAK